MAGSLASDRSVLEGLRRHESIRRIRAFFEAVLGRSVWWIFRSADSSCTLWEGDRSRDFRFHRRILRILKKRQGAPAPYTFHRPKRLCHFCMPLVCQGRWIGTLVLSGLRRGVPKEYQGLLTAALGLVVENCAKTAELDRLSATLKPRAIALSTVHTVHRIINSTLNLDELLSRLAHLTAQVMRVNRCAIYLVERPYLTCRAKVGYPKNGQKRSQFGRGIEGRVAKTAEIILRRKFISVPLIDEDVIGVMTVSSKKDHKDFSYFDLEILTTLAEEAVIAVKNAQLYEEQKRVTLSTIQALATILGTRVPSSLSSQALLRLVLGIAEELRLREEESQALHYAALLKDTARVGIPEEILRKSAKLTGEEYRLLREHPIKGAKIVQSFENLKPVAPIILYSREKYDGTGYPEGLKGEGIPIGARILAVVNAFEAIITGRPYRDQASLTEALEEIKRNSGTQFDPRVVEAFIRIVKRGAFQRLLRKA